MAVWSFLLPVFACLLLLCKNAFSATPVIGSSTVVPKEDCPVLYSGQICKAALLNAHSHAVVSTAIPTGMATVRPDCSGEQSPTAIPGATGSTSSQPGLMINTLNNIRQPILEEHVVNLLQPFQLPAVPASCLEQMKLLLCTRFFPLWPRRSEVCESDCMQIASTCRLPWQLASLTGSRAWLPNCSAPAGSPGVPCIDPMKAVTVASPEEYSVLCKPLSKWNHSCSETLANRHPAPANISIAAGTAFRSMASVYRTWTVPMCYEQIRPLLCVLAFPPDNCTVPGQTGWSSLQGQQINVTGCLRQHNSETAATQTGPMSLSPSSSGYQFGINSSVTSPAPGSTGLSQTVIRLILVLGTVGGTLLVILTIFLVIRAVRKHQLNYLRAGSRMDVERRVLTHRTSITDSVSSGYGSEGIVDNGRRMSRRGYASLSEFAMTSCPRPGSEWLGAYNPMFAADFHVPDSVKRIERDEIALLKKLKDVTYGKIHQAEVSELLSDELTTTVITKIASDACPARQHEDFCGEVNLLAKCKHDNIVRLLGVCLTSSPQLFCVEYMDLGNLYNFLREAATCAGTNGTDDGDVIGLDIVGGGSELLSHGDLAQIACQIASGMTYLSQKGFVHKDLAARSCQVSAGLHVRIADFGYARDVNSCDYYRMGTDKDTLLPIRWTAPEAIMFGQYTTASDVWSFGVTVWEIFTFGARPYGDYPDSDVIKVLTQFQLLELPTACPAKIAELVKKCFSKLTTLRPSFADLEHQLEKFYRVLNELNTVTSGSDMQDVNDELADEPDVSII